MVLGDSRGRDSPVDCEGEDEEEKLLKQAIALSLEGAEENDNGGEDNNEEEEGSWKGQQDDQEESSGILNLVIIADNNSCKYIEFETIQLNPRKDTSDTKEAIVSGDLI